MGALIILEACLLVGWMDAPTGNEKGTSYALHPADKLAVTAVVRPTERREAPELVSLGTFTVYAYCPCKRCCGQWSGMNLTASGTSPEVGVTVAADWSVLPPGTTIYLGDIGRRIVEDTGAGIDGKTLDLFMESHQEALNFGVQTIEIAIKQEYEEVR